MIRPPTTTPPPDSNSAPRNRSPGADDPNRPARLAWAALLRRVHRVHRVGVLVRTDRGDRLRVVAFVTGARIARKILDHLRIPPVVAPPPARPPPSVASDLPVDDPLVDPIYND